MARKTAKQIVEETMPDMEVSESPRPAAEASGTKPGPTMEQLRRKYLGAEAAAGAGDAGPQAAASDESDENDIEVKRVKAKQLPADPVNDPGPRTVIISKKKGVLGSQG